MPFDFYSFATSIGLEAAALPDMPPPGVTPLGKPLHQATLGVFVSCGVRLPDDPPLGATNDLTYRLVPREAPAGSLVLDHESPIRAFAERDLNVAYPRDRLAEFERDGRIGRLADNAVSMVGSITLYDPLMLQTVPRITDEFRRQDVDLVLLLAFCPGCHRAVSLIARGIEKRGLPTVTLTTLYQTTLAFKPPRAVFLDYPFGCPAGRPNDPADQRKVLEAALHVAEQPPGPWRVHELPFQFSPDGARDWEQAVKQLYRDKYAVLASHVGSHNSEGQALAGVEREFAVRCNC